jgi:DNA polymerase alpha subunit A
MSHRARLAELKALRESGKKVFDTYKVADVDNLYDEVDEDGYKKVVRERLNQDDFVVDDNGEGYADDGREDWDRVQAYGSESEEEATVRGRPSKTSQSSSRTCSGQPTYSHVV